MNQPYRVGEKGLIKLGYFVVPPEWGFWDDNYIVGVRHDKDFGYIIVRDSRNKRWAKFRMSALEIRLIRPSLLGMVIEQSINECIHALKKKEEEDYE